MTDERSERRGVRAPPVVAAMVAMLTFSVCVAAMTLAAGDFGLGQAAHLSGNATLAYLVWRGFRWARKLTALLASVSAVAFIAVASEQLVDLERSWSGMGLGLLGAIVYGAVAWVLVADMRRGGGLDRG